LAQGLTECCACFNQTLVFAKEFDMKAKILGLALAIGVAAPAAAEDLVITINNTSSMALVQFFTSPTEVNEWEEDVFGDGVLPAGNTVDVTIADGREQCIYDLKFVMEGGQEIIGTQDMCENPTFNLFDK
jgi:hypothetical protein